MKIENVKISDLILDPANARKHNDRNLEAIKGSLSRFGQQKPIVVNEKNVVIAGNGTLMAARALKWDVINIVRTNLAGTDLVAFGLADNRTADLAEWDQGALDQLLYSLHESEFDVTEIGFSFDDVKQPTEVDDPWNDPAEPTTSPTADADAAATGRIILVYSQEQYEQVVTSATEAMKHLGATDMSDLFVKLLDAHAPS